MRIHAILHGSYANGPGLRSVVWVRGCNLGCEGCVNRNTWDSEGGTEFTPESLASEVFMHCLPGTKGLTISGGEPLHQAVSLLQFFKEIKARRPDWSLGMFTGYSWPELTDGNYAITEPSFVSDDNWRSAWWRALYPMLDFVKLGRWRRDLPPSDKPLCSSSNQELILSTSRYTLADFGQNCMEWNIEADGMATVTGFPLK